MHVCLVNLDGFPYRSSGLAVYGETLATGLAELGHRVTVITARRPGLSSYDRFGRIEVHRVTAPADWMGFAWHASTLVEELARCQRFDVVHWADVHFAYRYRGPFVASVFQSFRQRLTSDGGLPYHSSWGGLALRMVYYRLARHLAEAPAAHRAGLLLAGSVAAADEFTTHYDVDPQRVRVVPLGVDLSRFSRVPAGDLRCHLGLEADDVVLLYVGFGTPRKGLEHLAQAMQQLPPRVKLVIVGRWEAAYRNKFYQALGDARDRVIERGYVMDDELPHYYSLADIFVFPSLLEGFGLPLAEALACGTPVVSTKVGATSEVVGPGGRLVPPRDPQALAAALCELADDANLRREIGDRGRDWVRKRFDRHRMVRETAEAYMAAREMMG